MDERIHSRKPAPALRESVGNDQPPAGDWSARGLPTRDRHQLEYPKFEHFERDVADAREFESVLPFGIYPFDADTFRRVRFRCGSANRLRLL